MLQEIFINHSMAGNVIQIFRDKTKQLNLKHLNIAGSEESRICSQLFVSKNNNKIIAS